MEDFRYVDFNHCRPWYIHSYKKLEAPVIDDIVDGNRMDHLLRAPINGGRAWPEPTPVPSVPVKRKETSTENQEQAAKRVKLGKSYCTFAEKSATSTHPDMEILAQPGVYDTAFGTPNEQELMSDSRERQRKEEEERKKKNEQAKQEKKEEKERLKKEAAEKKALEEQERAEKKKEKLKEKEKKIQEREMAKQEKEEEKKRKAEEKRKKKEDKKAADNDASEEEDDDQIEIVIPSEDPQAPPGGSELMALASMAKKEQPKPTRETRSRKKASKVPQTPSQCPEALTLNSLARIAKQEEAKKKKEETTTSTRTQTRSKSPAAQTPPKLVSIINPSCLPQVDGPEDEASSNFLGSFKRVRLLCRPWRIPSGSINRPAFKLMLEAVCMQVMTKPGITMQDLHKCFQPSLHMTPVMELIEVLHSIGCIKYKYISQNPKPTLFSKRTSLVEVESSDSLTTAIVLPTPDCILKLGQFVNDLLNKS